MVDSTDFNSKTVQLKEIFELEKQLMQSPFQFQNGSIKSINFFNSNKLYKKFNSKTVQLKGYTYFVDLSRCIFQFQNGSIKSNNNYDE